MSTEGYQQIIVEKKERLDKIWSGALSVLHTSATQLDANYGVGRSKRSIQLMSYANSMATEIDLLLKIDVHMTVETTRDIYAILEDLLVTNITNLVRLDPDVGLPYQKRFLDGNRSLTALIVTRLKSFKAQIGFWFDDGVRA